MTIEKLPSGSYRIVQMYEGKRYRVTVDHKPTQKEALQLLAEAMDGCSIKGTFRSAANNYIESKRNILSPRTIREYLLTCYRLPEWFVNMQVSQIDGTTVQKLVNELAKDLSAKTVRNRHGFISAVLNSVNPRLALKTALPRREKQEPYIPTKEDYKRLLEASRGTMFYIPIQLALYGLRRGEICALTIDDLDDNNVIHITKDLVINENRDWVIKPPKTASSVRNVPIDKTLADEIRKQGYIYNGFPNSISKFYARIQKKLGVPPFKPHSLRHLFASILMDKGYDLKTIQDLGGWSGNETVNRVYLHSLKLKDEEARRKIVDDMKDFLK